MTLTHWGRVTHICVSKLTIIGSDNGLSPGRRQAIIWTNAGIMLIRPLGTNFNEILLQIYKFSFKKIHWKMSSGKWRPFCFGLNELTCQLFVPWGGGFEFEWIIFKCVDYPHKHFPYLVTLRNKSIPQPKLTQFYCCCPIAIYSIVWTSKHPLQCSKELLPEKGLSMQICPCM